MAWLTTYDDTNKILDEKTERKDQVIYLSAGLLVTQERTVTEAKYRYVAMEKASAESGMTALIEDAPEGTTRQANIRRQGPSNGYDIEVFDIVYGDWAEV